MESHQYFDHHHPLHHQGMNTNINTGSVFNTTGLEMVPSEAQLVSTMHLSTDVPGHRIMSYGAQNQNSISMQFKEQNGHCSPSRGIDFHSVSMVQNDNSVLSNRNNAQALISTDHLSVTYIDRNRHGESVFRDIADDTGIGTDEKILPEIQETLSLFPFVCGLCYAKYDKITEYFTHLNTQHRHTEKYLHVCDDDVTNGDNTEFTCGICRVAFPSLCSLHSHIKDVENLSDFCYDSKKRMIHPPQRSTHVYTSSGKSSDRDQIYWSASKRGIWKRIIEHKNMVSNNIQKSKSNKNVIMKKQTAEAVNAVMIDMESNIKTEPDDQMSTSSEEDLNDSSLVEEEESSAVVKEENMDSDSTIDAVYTADEMNEAAEQELNEETIKVEKSEHEVYLDEWRKKYQRYLDQKKRQLRYTERTDDEEEKELDNDDNVSDDNDSFDLFNSTNEIKATDEDSFKFDQLLEETNPIAASEIKKCRKTSKRNKQESVRTLRYENRPSSISQQSVPCETCGALIKRKNLRSHRIQHQESRNYECELCGMKLKTITLLRTHKQNVHSEANSVVCDVCGKGFKNKHYLKQHQYVHTAERNLPCSKCDLMFKSKKCLRIHQLCHTESKTQQCTQCDRSFRRLEELRTHNKYVHSDARNEVCSFCGKAFKTMECVKKHEKTHLPHKHFCHVCGKSFAQAYNMKLHMKVHNDV